MCRFYFVRPDLDSVHRRFNIALNDRTVSFSPPCRERTFRDGRRCNSASEKLSAGNSSFESAFNTKSAVVIFSFDALWSYNVLVTVSVDVTVLTQEMTFAGVQKSKRILWTSVLVDLKVRVSVTKKTKVLTLPELTTNCLNSHLLYSSTS